MWLCKIIIALTLLISADSCKNCKGPFSPYIATFTLKNQNVDSISKTVIYFYPNNSAFNQAFDSLSVSKRQYDNDVDFNFMRKSDTLRTFMYKITFGNKSVKEYKIRLINDFCENCGECDEEVHPQTIEINGVSKANKGNIIDLN